VIRGVKNVNAPLDKDVIDAIDSRLIQINK